MLEHLTFPSRENQKDEMPDLHELTLFALQPPMTSNIDLSIRTL